MTVFAVPADLEQRWRTLTSEESARATVLLADASQLIIDECSSASAAAPETLKRVVCAMVKRAMLNSESSAGITSSQEMAGPFSRMLNYSNPTGDLYLTKSERRQLGCGGAKPFTIDTTPPVVE